MALLKQEKTELFNFSMKWIFLVVWIAAIGVVLLGLYDKFQSNSSDKIEFEDGNTVFVEAKYLLGSIYHKDVIVLTADNIEIRNNSFFGNKRTTYPYNVLREVSFSNSFNGYKVVIKYPSKFGFGNDMTTFYFNNKETLNTLYSMFHDMSKNRCVITEYF
jgi:hypothetical protein